MPRRRDYPGQLSWQCTVAGLPAPVREHRFSPPRRWRFDLAWPDHGKLAVEVDGGVYTQGRHTRGSGYVKDTEKLNTAAVQGWTVLRVVPEQITSGQALTWIEAVLHSGDGRRRREG